MITAFLIIFPLLLGVIAFSAKAASKWVAFAGSLIQLGVTIAALCSFDPNAGAQFAIDRLWVPGFNIHFSIGMDGISILMVLLTNLVSSLIFLSSFRTDYDRPALFYGLALMMQGALVGVFVSLDAFLFYIFWELALIPIYFIILLWGGANRVKVTFKFFIYTLFGSLMMLVGIIWLYYLTPNHSFAIADFVNVHPDRTTQGFLFWAFFLAFAIKMPVFPFHTWQPDTYTEAPPQGTMLLSGIMLKMGLYGVIRWLLPVVPAGVNDWGQLAIVLSIIGIVYGSWIAITQKDFKRLLAYSSFAHVGLISAGIFTLTLQGMQGGLIQMLTHGINVTGLFFVAQIFFRRTNSNYIPDLGGIIHKAPVLSYSFLLILLGSVALPLTNGFVGEFLLLSGVYQYNPWMAFFAALTIIFSAVYMLRAYQRTTLGELKPGLENFEDVKGSEAVVLVVICALVIAIGVYPKPLLQLTEPAVRTLLSTFYQPLTLR